MTYTLLLNMTNSLVRAFGSEGEGGDLTYNPLFFFLFQRFFSLEQYVRDAW